MKKSSSSSLQILELLFGSERVLICDSKSHKIIIVGLNCRLDGIFQFAKISSESLFGYFASDLADEMLLNHEQQPRLDRGLYPDNPDGQSLLAEENKKAAAQLLPENRRGDRANGLRPCLRQYLDPAVVSRSLLQTENSLRNKLIHLSARKLGL
jgi:hypothetical protein